MRNSILTGLALLVIGCSSNNPQSLSITPQNNVKVFGSIEQEYKPTIIRYEQEKDNLLVSSYLGFSSDEYIIPVAEVCNETQCVVIREEEKTYIPSVIMGIDTGFKQKWKSLYHRLRVGVGYISREFENHEFQNNFHIGYGIGIEGDYSIGLEYNHWSSGNKIFNWDKNKKNAGISTVGAVFELKF